MTAKSRYSTLAGGERQSYIRRAESCAKLTIPSLFPEESSTQGTSDFPQPYQSIGSRCVNTLSNKLLLALFPPNAAFFRLSPGSEIIGELQQDGKEDEKRKLETQLTGLEQLILAYIETHQIRVTIGEAIKQLAVAGNTLLFLHPGSGGVKLYSLRNYVLRRDAMGSVLEIITKDTIAYSALPNEFKHLIKDAPTETDKDKEIEVYTHILRDERDEDMYRSYQEIDEQIIRGSEGQYPTTNAPWLPLRMVKTDGESYGRSYVEEYIGDLRQAEAISKSLGELIALEAFVVHMVDPASMTRIKYLQKAKSGDFIPGRAQDIQPYTVGKTTSIQVAMSTLQSIEERLGYAFLLNSAVQRQGERVTAEEIRYAAQELEGNLGGVYSILTQELQLPLVRRLLSQLQTTGIIQMLPENSVSPEITTGMEALGRGNDLMKLQQFLQFLSIAPDFIRRLKTEGVLEKAANSLGLKASELIKSEEEVQEEIQQQQALMAMQQALQQSAANGDGGGGVPAEQPQPEGE